MVLMHIPLTRQLSGRNSPTTSSDLKIILWTHPLVHVWRPMLTRQFGRGMCRPHLPSVIRRSYRGRPTSRPSRCHIIAWWWRRHNTTLAVVLSPAVDKDNASCQRKNKDHTAPDGNSRYCSSAESRRRRVARLSWRRCLLGARRSRARCRSRSGPRSAFHLHGQVWSVKAADWRCFRCATSRATAHSRADVNRYNVRCQLGLIKRPNCILFVLLAQVHVVCALDARHIADLVRGVGVGSADDKHLRVVNHVAAHHALGEGSGALFVGRIWTSDPLEAWDCENVNIIVAR
jgi:hypothetical protein